MTDNSKGFSITPRAASQLKSLAQESSENRFFRIAVESGGCSGFQYQFKFEPTVQKDDLVFNQSDMNVIIDPTSFDFLKNAELDYIDELIGAYFTIKNPDTQSACGCGNSFSL